RLLPGSLLRGVLSDRRRARIDVVRTAVANGVELARRPVVATVERPVEHDGRAEAGADEQEGEVAEALRAAVALLGDRCEVDVVLERDRRAERVLQLLPELASPEAREVGGR